LFFFLLPIQKLKFDNKMWFCDKRKGKNNLKFLKKIIIINNNKKNSQTSLKIE